MSPQTMQGALVREHGDVHAVNWTEVPRPEPGAGEVRVAVRTAGMNHLDLWVRRGVEGHRFPIPLILGSDSAGTVEELGSGVDDLSIGDPVIVAPATSCGTCEHCSAGEDHRCRHYGILGESRDGACAEFVVVPATHVIPKPVAVDWPQAGCFALVALTAWTMLMDRARLQRGETVLVLGATSGVGQMAIQIAKLHGCTVIATAGSNEKLDLAQELGADHGINYKTQSIARTVKEITNREGVDVVFEHVGAATWSDSLRSLAWGGRLVTCGATTGAVVESDLRLIFFKNLSILGSTMGPRRHLPMLVDHLAAGNLEPLVDRVLPMRDVQAGHETLEAGDACGKVVFERD